METENRTVTAKSQRAMLTNSVKWRNLVAIGKLGYLAKTNAKTTNWESKKEGPFLIFWKENVFILPHSKICRET